MLHAIYGYYPTLHDAVIKQFDAHFAEGAIVMTFDY